MPGLLTIEDLPRGVSKLRNRVIGRVFHALGLIEQWGSGVQRMMPRARRLGSPRRSSRRSPRASVSPSPRPRSAHRWSRTRTRPSWTRSPAPGASPRVAVYHRDYQVREPIEVRMGPEDLVVLSFPGPDRSIRMEELQAGRAISRRYRNRRIGEFLKELVLTEGRSTGVPKIIRTMPNSGSPPPEFESDEDRTYFLIRLPVHQRMEGAPHLALDWGAKYGTK